MHSYRPNYEDTVWEVFFDDGAPDSEPRVLRKFNTEWHAMQLVSFLNGGSKSADMVEWLFK